MFGIKFAFPLRMARYLLPILWILCFVASVRAEVYLWLDRSGTSHFTDDLTQIPEAYRANAKKVEGMDIGEGKGTVKRDGEPRPYKDRMGRGEEYWKAKVQQLRERIRLLQEKNENLRGRYNDLTTKYNDSRSSVERANLRKERDSVKAEMDENRGQIENAKIALEKKIPEEAEMDGAKPEWIR